MNLKCSFVYTSTVQWVDTVMQGGWVVALIATWPEMTELEAGVYGASCSSRRPELAPLTRRCAELILWPVCACVRVCVWYRPTDWQTVHAALWVKTAAATTAPIKLCLRWLNSSMFAVSTVEQEQRRLSGAWTGKCMHQNGVFRMSRLNTSTSWICGLEVDRMLWMWVIICADLLSYKSIKCLITNQANINVGPIDVSEVINDARDVKLVESNCAVV